MAQTNTSRILSQLLAVVLAVVGITALYLGKTVVLPLALALLFGFILTPAVEWLERLRFPRIVAILLVIVTAGALLGVVGWTVFTQLVEVTSDLPSYGSNIREKIDSFEKSKTNSVTRAEDELDRLGEQIGGIRSEAANGRPGAIQQELSPEQPIAVREVGGNSGRLDAVSGVLGVVISILLVIVFTFFILLKREDLRNRMIRLSGKGHLHLMTQAMEETSRRLSRYLSLQLLVNAGYGSIIFLALHVIGLPHALLFGALAALLRFIPYIGAPISAFLPIALSVAVFNGWTKTLLIMVIFFVMEVVTANFLEPHVYGKQTGLSSLAILVAAIFWALIWGPVGLILSVPLTVCLVVLGSHVPSLELLTVLLGDQPVMRPEARYYQRLLANDQREANLVLENYLKDATLLELYDQVLIPALNLAEQDRHQNALDQPTVDFIAQTTKDLVEELSLRKDEAKPPASDVSPTAYLGAAALAKTAAAPGKKITCLPVRDDADEIVGIMLAQLLERQAFSTRAIPIGSVDGMLAEVAKTAPDIVCLSALPPYAISHARRIYSRLRAQNPALTIIIGLWTYTEDPAKAASEISGGEEKRISTSLAQSILQISLISGVAATPEAASADERLLELPPQVVS